MRVQLIVALYQEVNGSTASALTRSTAVAALEVLQKLTKHLGLYSKMFLRMQQLFVGRFVALPHANELVLYYWAQVVEATSGSSELISGKTALKYQRSKIETFEPRFTRSGVSCQTSRAVHGCLSRKPECLVWKGEI